MLEKQILSPYRPYLLKLPTAGDTSFRRARPKPYIRPLPDLDIPRLSFSCPGRPVARSVPH